MEVIQYNNFKVSIFGIGGHAKVVIHLAKLNNIDIKNLYDDNKQKINTFFSQIIISELIDENFNGNMVIAVGDNMTRKKISDSVTCLNTRFDV